MCIRDRLEPENILRIVVVTVNSRMACRSKVGERIHLRFDDFFCYELNNISSSQMFQCELIYPFVSVNYLRSFAVVLRTYRNKIYVKW